MKHQLESVRRTFDLSAKTRDRVLAIHFTEGGRPVDPAIYDAIYERIDALVEFAPDDDVLEVGAGSGLLLERIARRVRRACGTDISAGVLELVPPFPNVELQQMDSDALRYPDASFDKVVLNAVIQLLPRQGLRAALPRGDGARVQAGGLRLHRGHLQRLPREGVPPRGAPTADPA